MQSTAYSTCFTCRCVNDRLHQGTWMGYVRRTLQYWKRQGIECPIDGIWSFILETSKLFKKQLHIIELEYYKKYGRIHGRIMGFKPQLCVADPQILKKVFVKDFNTFHNRMVRCNGFLYINIFLSFNHEY
ncbi:cytochrome P450 6g1-like [Centruroides sculpturatus]|uniref:cytochrome P450 6g1-like n=1 Tax=Centruroides sculpturatus TaxID=218467 RepID=UPI000C6E97CF|nr:cytochrome P450 6g1-like [Centruroides sculpturatus]